MRVVKLASFSEDPIGFSESIIKTRIYPGYSYQFGSDIYSTGIICMDYDALCHMKIIDFIGGLVAEVIEIPNGWTFKMYAYELTGSYRSMRYHIDSVIRVVSHTAYLYITHIILTSCYEYITESGCDYVDISDAEEYIAEGKKIVPLLEPQHKRDYLHFLIGLRMHTCDIKASYDMTLQFESIWLNYFEIVNTIINLNDDDMKGMLSLIKPDALHILMYRLLDKSEWHKAHIIVCKYKMYRQLLEYTLSHGIPIPEEYIIVWCQRLDHINRHPIFFQVASKYGQGILNKIKTQPPSGLSASNDQIIK
jgi:hypothetical protein